MIMFIEFSFHYRLGKVLANISYFLTHVLALGHLSTSVQFDKRFRARLLPGLAVRPYLLYVRQGAFSYCAWHTLCSAGKCGYH